MEDAERSARPSVGTIITALLVGLLVLLILFPATVATSDPPVCSAMLFYPVPCEGWVAPVAGAVVASLVGYASWRAIERRRWRERVAFRRLARPVSRGEARGHMAQHEPLIA